MKYIYLFSVIFFTSSFSLKEKECLAVCASQIYLKATTEQEFLAAWRQANDLIARINKGESFETLAKKYSNDPQTQLKGGYMGWFTKKQMQKSFEKACFNAKDSMPFQVTTCFGLHVVKVTAKKKISCDKLDYK